MSLSRLLPGLKIALVQMLVGPDKAKNVAAAVKEIHKAKQQGAQLVALPECFNSPKENMNAEEVPFGETCRALSAAAAEAGVCVVGGTLPERQGGALYSTSTVWGPDGALLARHRKEGGYVRELLVGGTLPERQGGALYSTSTVWGRDGTLLARHRKEGGYVRALLVGGTLPERQGGALYSTSTVWGPDGALLARHRKVHLYDIDIPKKLKHKESEMLSAGNQITTFVFNGVKIGLGICFDMCFSEMAELMAQDGCSLLIFPGDFNVTAGRRYWELIGRIRALDHQLWVALVSPARDTSADYQSWGHSMLVDPWGNIKAQLDENVGTILEDIDLNVVEEVRRQMPIKPQRRTDLYNTVRKMKMSS
ncbi:omega-amidase NIT2-like [Ostrinia nubilalis]|uniref:omega-amidase NIT2-like n=1 Tax=Ostrinia nubilalis TaxID=29057 RepID=UPI00308221BA